MEANAGEKIANRNAARPRNSIFNEENKIKVIQGKAKFETDHRVRVTYGDKEIVVDGEQFIIATGSEPTELPFAPFDGKWILNSTHAMSLKTYRNHY